LGGERNLEFRSSHRLEEVPVDTPVSSDLAAHDHDGKPANDSLLHELHGRLAELGDPGPGELTIGLSDSREGLCVVALGGEMDMSNAAELTRRVDSHLNGEPCRMIVDLSRLEFLDSCGIRELIKVARAVKEGGGAFALAAPTPIVARVLAIGSLCEYMAVEPSLGAAFGHVRPDTA
jgi:anti-sigma B factor antagonist